jgi:hypothetical protein
VAAVADRGGAEIECLQVKALTATAVNNRGYRLRWLSDN